jgi:pyruvate ferredoxin oxidoreductase gamma subunit
MLEIVILGRGGQGAQTAGNQLAEALFEEGYKVQVFSTYGGARRGTPVTSSLRIDSEPIRRRCNITSADALLCFDESLLDDTFLRLAGDRSFVLVNSAKAASALPTRENVRVVPVDGRAIAQRNEMGKVVNSALLGAFVAILAKPGIGTMCRVIENTAPVKIAQNLAACREAYGLMRAAVGEAQA